MSTRRVLDRGVRDVDAFWTDLRATKRHFRKRVSEVDDDR